MNQGRSWFKGIVLLGLMMLISMLSGCSSDSVRSNNEALRIYEMAVAKGKFAAVAGDATATRFQLNLSEVPEQILYFTNRGATESGYDSIDNVMNKVWPRVYGTVAPNAVMQATTADQGTINLLCILDKPVYNKGTGELGFTVTYLDGRRPAANLALTDVKIIIANNAASAQPGVWSQLMSGDAGTLIPAKDPGIYTFSMQKTIGGVYEFTSAPQRKSSNLTVKRYIESWQTRFGTDPPNATIAYNAKDNPAGGVQVVTLTNPVYNENTGSISFTAKLLFGTAPIGADGLAVKNPSLFIDGNNGGDFPAYADNVFSIQYRNSTDSAITVWLTGDQPPCSKAEAAHCDTSGAPSAYADKWKALAAPGGSFEKSGTKFYIIKTDGTQQKIDPSNSVDLETGEILRIVPPIVSLRLGDSGIPEWYYKRGGKIETAGTNSWVTRKGVSMPAPPNDGLVFEHNVQGHFTNPAGVTLPDEVVWDVSGVNGVHVKATMHFEGPGCGTRADCACDSSPGRTIKIPLEAYNATNSGCPYISSTANGNGFFNTCVNPKLYPYDDIGNIIKPDWARAAKDFTLDNVPVDYQNAAITDLAKYNTDYPDSLNYGTLSGFVLADAAAGVDKAGVPYKDLKSAYHIWWRTNPVALGWLSYLQNNVLGKGEVYGWAYDEVMWHLGDTFDNNGNPLKKDGQVDTNNIYPAITCPSKPLDGTKEGKYLNIDILYVM